MQKYVNLVDLAKSFPTNIYLQNLASIQKRTSPVKFAHLAEKSGKGSISNLSTKARRRALGEVRGAGLLGRADHQHDGAGHGHRQRGRDVDHAVLTSVSDIPVQAVLVPENRHTGIPVYRSTGNPNFGRSVLGCIEVDFRNQT